VSVGYWAAFSTSLNFFTTRLTSFVVRLTIMLEVGGELERVCSRVFVFRGSYDGEVFFFFFFLAQDEEE
jgi:hypothetical protein